MEEFYNFLQDKQNFVGFGEETKGDVIKILEDEIYIAKTFERNLSAKNLGKVLTYIKQQK